MSYVPYIVQSAIVLVLVITAFIPFLQAEENSFGIINPEIESGPGTVFIENRGQLSDSAIEYYTRGDLRAALGQGFIRYALDRPEGSDTIRTDCWEVGFSGSSYARSDGLSPIPTMYSFHYDDRSISSVRSFESVHYENIYPGIDLLYKDSGDGLKYDLILNPGSDPHDIRMEVKGISSMKIDHNDLVLELDDGFLIREGGLKVFYEDTREEIGASFTIIDGSSFSFNIDDYDRSRTLVIDPVVFATYVGGIGSEQANAMCADNDGNVLVTGTTSGREFPITPGSYKSSVDGNQDAYIFRLSKDGSTILHSTFIGGDWDDSGLAITTDDSGNIYMAGRTASTDYPTSNGAYQLDNGGGYDIVMSKLDKTLSNLLISTYVGGASTDRATNIEIDSSGNIYVAGSTSSLDFPLTPDPICGEYGGGDIDGYLIKLNPQGTNAIYSTYICGDEDDRVSGLSVDSSGNAYISGMTRSTNFPLTDDAMYDEVRGSTEGYVMKIASDGSSIINSTLIGGSAGEGIYDLDQDLYGNVYVTGLTYSDDIPVTSGVISETPVGGADIFVTQLNSNLSVIIRSSYMGSPDYDKPLSMVVDDVGRIIIGGTTSSTTFPVTEDAYQSAYGGDPGDNFLMAIRADLTTIQYASYIGGDGWFDVFGGVDVEARGQIFTAGSTDYDSLNTTVGAHNTSMSGFEDVYVVSITLDTPPGPPGNLQDKSGDSFVHLTWEEPEYTGSQDMDGYDVYRGDASLSEIFHSSVGNVLEFNDTDVENGKSYYYFVTAKNIALDSIPSIEVIGHPLGKPSKPIDFQVAPGINKVDISWNHPLDLGGASLMDYRIYKENGDETDEFIVPSTSFEYRDEDVTAGIEYSYYMTARNIVGESSITSIEVVVPISLPSPPGNISLHGGDGFIEISWSHPEFTGGLELTEYNIYRSEESGIPRILRSLTYKFDTYNDTKVVNGLNYTYYLTAVNGVGESIPSETVSVTPITLPTVPIDVRVSASDSSVIVEWEPPLSEGGSPIDGYQISRSNGSDESPVMIDVDGDSTEYQDDEVENGITYTYRIRALNEVGPSDWSSDLTASPLSVPSAATLTIISFGSYFIRFAWEEPVDNGGVPILSFDIYRGTTSDSMQLLRSINPGTLSYNDTGVQTSVEYFYSICAVNSMGSSLRSEVVSATPMGIPSEPLNLEIILGDGTVELSWQEPDFDGGSPVTSYYITRVVLTDDSIEKFTSDSTTFIDTDPILGSTVRYMVKAVNSVGAGVNSLPEECIPVEAPGVIIGLSGRIVDGVAIISWDSVDTITLGEVNIEVWRSVDGGEPFMIADLDGDTTEFRDENIISTSVYTYHVIVTNSVSSSAESDIITIEISAASDGGISAAGWVILIVGTLIPLLISLILIFLILSRRGRSKEDKMEEQQVKTDQIEQPVSIDSGSMDTPELPSTEPMEIQEAPIQDMLPSTTESLPERATDPMPPESVVVDTEEVIN